MSHKRFYAVFEPGLLKWEVKGIPYDEGEYNKKDELYLGPFQTKRAAQYVCFFGYLSGSIKEIEAAAKEEELASNEPLPVNTGLAEEDPVILLARTSYLQELVSRMMD